MREVGKGGKGGEGHREVWELRQKGFLGGRWGKGARGQGGLEVKAKRFFGGRWGMGLKGEEVEEEEGVVGKAKRLRGGFKGEFGRQRFLKGRLGKG